VNAIFEMDFCKFASILQGIGYAEFLACPKQPG